MLPVNAWGAASSLIEYGDNPVTTETLRKALNDDVPGSSYIAWTLAHNGHKAVLPEALARALRVVDRSPAGDYTDLQGAAALLRDFGNDQQLRQLAAWSRSIRFGTASIIRLCGSMLPRRVIRARRACWLWCCGTAIQFPASICASAISRWACWNGRSDKSSASGGKTLAERDEALSRAMAWLAMNGFAN